MEAIFSTEGIKKNMRNIDGFSLIMHVHIYTSTIHLL